MADMAMNTKNSNQSQFGLFGQDAAQQAAGHPWPDAERFPHNAGTHKVVDQVRHDFRDARYGLVITAYTAIEYLVAFLDRALTDAPEAPLCVLIGHDPAPAKRRHFGPARKLPVEIRNFWVRQGISLSLCGALPRVIQAVRDGTIEVRRAPDYPGLHAKLYVTDSAAMLGSSNLSLSGMSRRLEANARFQRADDKQRYKEARQIADNFWTLGLDYSEEFGRLLHDLLRVAEWQDALARATAELLEGEWAKAYLPAPAELEVPQLWPAQTAGVARALALLDSVGSVIVADATGSGKTRMGAHLLRALHDRLWSSGQGRGRMTVALVPPSVQTAWNLEAMRCNLTLKSDSHGHMSRSDSETARMLAESVQRTQVLAIDEAHRFLNIQSQRTQAALNNMADHVIAFTATPINRHIADLESLINLLGADNLDDDTLAIFESAAKKSRSSPHRLSSEEIDTLRGALSQFVIRRTKRQFNQLVESDEAAYLLPDGRTARYPVHECKKYPLNESAADRALITAIREQALQLRGLIWLGGRITRPKSRLFHKLSDQDILNLRIASSTGLARHKVMSLLRSSNAALYEHIRGTADACQRFSIEDYKKTDTGGIRQRLDTLKKPTIALTQIECPAWLADSEAFNTARAEEMTLYDRILDLLGQLSGEREKGKAAHIVALMRSHKRLLAFDSNLCTLALMQKVLRENTDLTVDCLVGERSDAEKRRIMGELGREASGTGIVALCSDAVSESVNLQGASAVVNLDLPATVRLIEQRVGRIDRMDSPFDRIQAWWPDDAHEFQIQTDKKLGSRMALVEQLLGSNVELPDTLQGLSEMRADQSAQQQILAYRHRQDEASSDWQGIEDAFAPVEALVQGPKALIDRATYRQYVGVQAQVMGRVSLVNTKQPWAFFCLAGDQHGAPKWLLFDSLTAEPITRFGPIAQALRERLVDPANNLEPTGARIAVLEKFIQRLLHADQALLPMRKRRIVREEIPHCLKAMRKRSANNGDTESEAYYDSLLELLNNPQRETVPDWRQLAERWLTLIRPVWRAHLNDRKGARLFRMRHIRKNIIESGVLEPEHLNAALAGDWLWQQMDRRVAACIIGVDC